VRPDLARTLLDLPFQGRFVPYFADKVTVWNCDNRVCGHSVMKIVSAILLIILLGVADAFSPSFADIYKYVDEAGVVHFTNVPTDARFKFLMRERRVQFRLGPGFEKYDGLIWQAAEKYKIDYALVKAVIKAESNFNPLAVSRVGARGLMQLMPRTAHAMQVNDSFHPEENIEGGVRYLRYLLNLFKGELPLALAAYNAGEKTVAKYKGIPPYPETRTYIRRVLQFYEQYRNEPRKPEPSGEPDERAAVESAGGS
jgi:hypothetical protein